MEIIKTQNLTFTYPNHTTPALFNLTLEINSGEFVCVCGKSGCGKTTLLRQLKPILSPYGKREGKVLFEGNNLFELSQREQTEKIGFVLQSPEEQIVTDKVWHELAFGLESLSYSTTEIRTRVAEMASFFGLEELFYKDTSELSGGQKQLLNLASVMVMQPTVLILDEPTSQLDPVAAQEFLKMIEKINKELGTTVILSEHRLEEAFSVSDRVIVLENGSVLADGTPQAVGKILNETNNDMRLALPTAMRVYFALDNQGAFPVTVREGRIWLENMKNEGKVKEGIQLNKSAVKNSGEAVVNLDGVWFRYNKNSDDVIKGLSLKVKKGELYAIVGGNGAGKTTVLSQISSCLEPYRGKVETKGKVSGLTQNPKVLFSKKTLWEELDEMLDESKLTYEQKKNVLHDIISLCELDELLGMHPYDLSGGELQRAAIAKVILTSTDILLLDEPTKGLDAHFKEKLANILYTLKQNGMTIVMVSHDIEFCAEYADRCGLLFDGKIVSEGEAREFFAGKSFYTTSANRMSRGIIENAVLADDIISACGKEVIKENKEIKMIQLKNNEVEKKIKKERIKIKNIVWGIVFFLLFCVAQFVFYDKFEYNDWRNYAVQILGIVFLGATIINFVPKGQFEFKENNKKYSQSGKKLFDRQTALTLAVVLIAVPITIFIGMHHFGDRRYYFISILIILEIFIPFIFNLEKKKPDAKELVTLSVLCAIGVIGRLAFSALPQFKPVAALVIIAGAVYGADAGFFVGALTLFISNFFHGQGPWTPWQMAVFGALGFLAGIFFNKGLLKKNKISLCIFGAAIILFVYGPIMNCSSVVLYQPNPTAEMFITYIVAGIPFDIIHAVSTVFFLWFASVPLIEKLDRIKIKHG